MKKSEKDRLKVNRGILDIPEGVQLGFVIQKNGVIRAKKIWTRKKRKNVV